VRGYEMHMGRTEGPDAARPMLTLGGQPDGAVSKDGRVAGCYLHGLFSSDPFRAKLLAGLRPDRASGLAYEPLVDAVLERLADHLEAHLDVERLSRLSGLEPKN
jgi:adenosylcobyric acid synthase